MGSRGKDSLDYIFIQTIGDGSFGSVFRCQEIKTKTFVAIKTMTKDHLHKHEKFEAAIREKNILIYLTETCGGSPLITELHAYFHDRVRIYFVMDLIENGDLAHYIEHYSSFDLQTAQFYSAEVLAGLTFLHKNRILHRDIKPHNVLIRKNAHIVIADFGSAQAFGGLELSQEGFTEENQAVTSPTNSRFTWEEDEDEQNSRRNTFVGTDQYVSPEMLLDGDIGPKTDMWGLGCIIYQLLSSATPFNCQNSYQILRRIKNLDYTFPDGFPEIAKDLVSKILTTVENRISGEEIMAHPFYEGIDFENIATSEPPGFRGYVPGTGGDPGYYTDITDSMKPGLDEHALKRLLKLDRRDTKTSENGGPLKPSTSSTSDNSLDLLAASLSKSQIHAQKVEKAKIRAQKLEEQRLTNPFHIFTNNKLILKQGFLDKKRGLFARRRMFLLTEGPHLLYIDAPNQVLKGEIPWTPCMQIELKNSGCFFIHTPNRIYYLFDQEKTAEKWCEAIEEVRRNNAKFIEDKFNQAMRDGTYTSIYGKKKSRKEMLREQKELRRKQRKEEEMLWKASALSQKGIAISS